MRSSRGTGRPVAAEKTNQPVLVQVEVPYGTPPGSYVGALTVTADGRATRLPLRVQVFPVTLPRPGTRIGNLLTSFYVSPQSYVSKAAQLYDFTTHEQRIRANRSLFALLGSYRISPSSWGFGEPRGPRGYRSSPKWWRDSAANFLGQLRSTPGFSAMRIPISNNHTSERNYIAGLSPFEPQTWCGYLRRVRTFWARHDALRADSIAYLYGFDEPGRAGQRLVARQAATLHRCFPEGRQLMTGNPSRANAFLRDGKAGNDLDIWTVQSRRYYGRFARAGRNRARGYLKMINKVRARGKMVWSYTYTGRGHAGLLRHRAALERAPLHALERARGNRWCPLRTGNHDATRKRTPSGRSGRASSCSSTRAGPGRSRALGSSRSATGSRIGRSSTRCGSGGVARGAGDSRPRGALQCNARQGAARLHAGLRAEVQNEVRLAPLVA